MTVKKLLFTSAILCACFGCTNKSASTAENQTKDPMATKKPINMQNLVSIIEIPTTDFKRAIAFYKSILAVPIEETEMGGVKMGIFPSGEGAVNVVLANGSDYTPTSNGCILYLNGGENLQPVLDKIEANGGKILVSKTEISPDMGFFALFTDTEGNKMGLHSKK